MKPVASSLVIFSLFHISVAAQWLSAEQLAMETVVVTSTREGVKKSDLAESISVVTAKDIEWVSPSHPAEILNRMPGVHINNLGGEGHMTSIRHPITTAGVYLFLEEGVPTRPTGYFNHNGLYEINIPQSSAVEVTKGPGSALYGSEAIGGIINSLTQGAHDESEVSVNVEAGSYQWLRGLISAGLVIDEDTGLRIDLNLTDNEGYRDDADYTRYSLSTRFDSVLSDHWRLKAIASYSAIEQSGTSSLELDDYNNRPKRNLFSGDIGYRDVDALRVHAEFAYQTSEEQLVTMTPFFRHNKMLMMPSWMITYDPNVRDYQFQSYGALFKFRQDVAGGQGRWIAGLDVDFTPSSYEESEIDDSADVTLGSIDGRLTPVDGIYQDYALTGNANYDFDTDQLSVSPYLHGEWRFNEQWKMTAGLRYDYFNVDYDNKLDGVTSNVSDHLRVASQSVSYDQLSPKWSLIYQLNNQHTAYVNYRHGFRAPTIGNLFRSGSSEDTEQLEAVTVKSVEIGVRGHIGKRLQYELALYDMKKTDDIVSVIEGDQRLTVNAGETVHRGVELGIEADLSQSVKLHLAWTYTDQSYDDFTYIYGYFDRIARRYVTEQRNYDGNDIAIAPEQLGNIAVSYTPQVLQAFRVELEYEKIGAYFTDETNTLEYSGHDLFNVRANYKLSDDLSLYVRIMNIGDKHYSTRTSAQVGDDDSSYRPGSPRAAYVGVRARF